MVIQKSSAQLHVEMKAQTDDLVHLDRKLQLMEIAVDAEAFESYVESDEDFAGPELLVTLQEVCKRTFQYYYRV